MCNTCGCGSDHATFSLNKPEGHTEIMHEHGHSHVTKTVLIETDILSKNNLLAERNRGYFEAKNIRVFNLVSSPGSGKTTLLEKLIQLIIPKTKIYVIEGDQQTSLDADRINEAGATAIQINTGKGCHLDAHMVNHAVNNLKPGENSLLFIENVGNLICPALFDLGENLRIAIISVTEGEDKPLKYPDIFQGSQLCILNKTDLLPYLNFNHEYFKNNLLKVNPAIKLFLCSARTGEGMEILYHYLLKD
jgi:hydrogenase nickel incorporation protein HypB